MENRQNNKLTTFGIVASACVMYAASAGLRSIYGIMLDLIADGTGIAYATVSIAIAIGQLVFGVAQPGFGIVALKKSNRFVLVLGSIFMAAGLGAIPFCNAPWMLIAAFGVILPIGTGAVSFGMIMGAITPKLGETKAAAVSGMVNASSGMGSIVFSPVMQAIYAATNLRTTMFGFAAFAILLVPAAIMVSDKRTTYDADDRKEKTSALPMIKKALSNRDYWCLILGFFTCGFHMTIVETHLYSQVLSYGIADATAAIIFSVYGIAAVIGSLISGFMCTKVQMRYVAGTIYGSRVVWVVGFLLLPKNIYTITLFVILLGISGPATISPTSGLTGKMFGAESLATLFGLIFLSHQVGSFFSAWLGGQCVKMTGEYTFIWMAAAVLSFIASVASYRIRTR